MNYRHAFHAGGYADVVKHAVLSLVLEYLKRKDAPFLALDSHAGRGRYNLADAESERTGEAQSGIARLFTETDVPTTLVPYLGVVRAFQEQSDVLQWYPGSPRVVRALMRRQDRLFVAERHPEDAVALMSEFAGDRQVKVFPLDGYHAVRSFLPPRERRGLVLIDPPFESADEFERLAEALRDGLARWATGTFVLWYPIKRPSAVTAFLDDVVTSCGSRTAVALELLVSQPDGIRLAGCGLVVVNPPYTLSQDAEAFLPYLAKLFGGGYGAEGRIVPLCGS